jgi:hypothetical protein
MCGSRRRETGANSKAPQSACRALPRAKKQRAAGPRREEFRIAELEAVSRQRAGAG